MAGFEPRISGVGSGTATALISMFLVVFQWFPAGFPALPGGGGGAWGGSRDGRHGGGIAAFASTAIA